MLAGPTRLNGATFCADYGVPGMMSLPGGYPIEFIQKPDQLTIIYEVNNETRRIYIGDRQVPPEQRLPSRAGYSAGHWEGNVLVVKTTDLLDGAGSGRESVFGAGHDRRALLARRRERHEGPDLSGDDHGSGLLHGADQVRAEDTSGTTASSSRTAVRTSFGTSCSSCGVSSLKAGKPVEARMSDVYKVREERE